MFSGRFGNTTGRPYLEALVRLPRLKLESGVSFIVDTGADQTVLMPTDALKMGVNYRKLRIGGPLIGIGGSCMSFTEQAIVVMSDEDRKILFAYQVNLQIVDKKAAVTNHPYCASLLGRNILDRLKMHYNAQDGKVTFTLLSADAILPLNSRDAKNLQKRVKSQIRGVILPD